MNYWHGMPLSKHEPRRMSLARLVRRRESLEPHLPPRVTTRPLRSTSDENLAGLVILTRNKVYHRWWHPVLGPEHGHPQGLQVPFLDGSRSLNLAHQAFSNLFFKKSKNLVRVLTMSDTTGHHLVQPAVHLWNKAHLDRLRPPRLLYLLITLHRAPHLLRPLPWEPCVRVLQRVCRQAFSPSFHQLSIPLCGPILPTRVARKQPKPILFEQMLQSLYSRRSRRWHSLGPEVGFHKF